MKSIKLYKQDAYLSQCNAQITSARLIDSGVLLEFDRTVFFPEGGGQSCDTGQIYLLSSPHTPFKVVNVFEREGRVFHEINLPPDIAANLAGDSSTNPLFQPGADLVEEIDWPRRFDNMQRHCGEHILSGIFYREYGGVNRGFHMGADYMTIDISMEENPEYTVLTYDMAKNAELLANKVIWENLPVTVRHFHEKSEAASLPLRKPLTVDRDITVVCVGDTKNASDCVACCGTHPSSAGQVGLIKIWKVEAHKGMFRVYCEAGSRAFYDYQRKHDLILSLGNKYSAGADDLAEKLNSQDDKLRAAKEDLARLQQILIKDRISQINEDIEAGKDFLSPKILVREFPGLRVDSLLHIGRPFESSNTLVLLIDGSANTLLLFGGGKADCGKLVKENAGIYNGKGGGRPESSRAMFPNREFLDTFIDLLEKHLR